MTVSEDPMYKQYLSVLLLAIVMVAGMAFPSNAEYPDKPIVIIVHAKPGGAIDLTARMISKVARNYSDTPLVIENRYGGSGAVAMRAVLGKEPDGYHLLAFPATFISAVQVTRSSIGMDDYRFLACMVEAPEALITNRNSDVVSIEDIIRDAKEKNGSQIWVGPGVGSLDHLMAIKTWDKLGITATWLPYDGGGEAVAALLGGHGTVYVGNPEDVRGRPDLNIAVVSAEQRLPRYPDVPTFLDINCDLPNEIMWRGFAVNKETPDDICNYLTNLLDKVSNDPEWKEFVEFNSAKNVFYKQAEFSALVNRDSDDAVKYLKMANIIAGEPDEQAQQKRLIGLILFPFVIIAMLVVAWITKKNPTGQMSIAGVTLALSLLFLMYALSFPPSTNGQNVGPNTIPIIWAIVLSLFSFMQIVSAMKNPEANKHGRISLVMIVSVLMILFVTLLPIIGFFLSTLILLVGGIYAMNYRKHLTVVLLTAGMMLFCWAIFIKTLGLPLPSGSLFG
jgi:putative tricarboxylic transport membrane protein